MDMLEFDASMHVGVAEIDAQHARLAELINTLFYAYAQGRERQVLADIINQLHDYARYHFATEEGLMRAHGQDYAELAVHLGQHAAFFSKVVDFLLEYVSDEGAELAPDLLQFMMDWLKHHIKGIDARFGAYLNARGVH